MSLCVTPAFAPVAVKTHLRVSISPEASIEVFTYDSLRTLLLGVVVNECALIVTIHSFHARASDSPRIHRRHRPHFAKGKDIRLLSPLQQHGVPVQPIFERAHTPSTVVPCPLLLSPNCLVPLLFCWFGFPFSFLVEIPLFFFMNPRFLFFLFLFFSLLL